MSFKYFDFICNKCNQVWEELIKGKLEKMPRCVRCKTNKNVTKNLTFGGYYIFGDNSGSVRPKGAGHRGGVKKK